MNWGLQSSGVQEYLSGIQEASIETRKLNGLKRQYNLNESKSSNVIAREGQLIPMNINEEMEIVENLQENWTST